MSIRELKPAEQKICFENCIVKSGKYTNRALGYVLKYLPYEDAVKYYERLLKSSNDKVLRKILVNEIPFLAVKDEYKSIIKDDRILLDGIENTYLKKYIDKDRLNQYKSIADKYNIL